MICTPRRSAFIWLSIEEPPYTGRISSVLCHVGQIAGNLQTQFAGRCQHKRLRHIVRGIDTLYERQTECGGFACSGLCQSHHIAVTVEQHGYNFFLDGHGIFETHFGDGAEQVIAHAQFFECHVVM